MRSYDKALTTVHHSHAGGTGRESLPIIKCQAATAGINDIHPISQCGLPQGLYGLQCPASVGIQVEFPALAHILPLVGGGSGETCYGLHHPLWLIVSEVVNPTSSLIVHSPCAIGLSPFSNFKFGYDKFSFS